MVMRLVVLVAACALAACGASGVARTASPSPSSTSAEVARCSRTEFTGTVVGAFTVRAVDLAEQDETRGSPSGPRAVRSSFRDYASDTPIVLCFFDGFIAAPGGPPQLPPATFRPYDRYLVTVDPSGRAVLRVAGHRDTIAVAPRLP